MSILGLIRLSHKAVESIEPATLFLCHRTDVSVMICCFHSAMAYKLKMTFFLIPKIKKIKNPGMIEKYQTVNVRNFLTFYSSSTRVILIDYFSHLPFYPSALVPPQLTLCALNQAVNGDLFPMSLLY